MSGAPDDGGEHGPGSIVSGEAGFAHAGPVVDDKSSNVFVTHVGRFSKLRRKQNQERKYWSEEAEHDPVTDKTTRQCAPRGLYERFYKTPLKRCARRVRCFSRLSLLHLSAQG